MFPMSKCRGDRDVGLCTTSGLAFGEPRRSGDFWKKTVFRRRKNWILPIRWELLEEATQIYRHEEALTVTMSRKLSHELYI